MASDKENARTFKPAPPPPLPPPVFPPLPPLPPPDANGPAAAWSDQQPRAFGRRLTNTMGPRRDNVVGQKNFQPSALTAAMAAAQRYYHQYQYVPQHGIQRSSFAEAAKETTTVPTKAWSSLDKENAAPTSDNEADEGSLSQAFAALSLSSPSPEADPWSCRLETAKTGHLNWSVTPEELSELAVEVAAMKEQEERTRKLSYAEASKRNLPGSTEKSSPQKPSVIKVEKPRPVFKKYFALPTIVPSQPSKREFSDVEPVEEKDNRSAETPTFYPRQTTDANEIIQMLKSSLTPKKVAPHMDWWPGDWKCINCGNHVLSFLLSYAVRLEAMLTFLDLFEPQNFSYRDTCKRCRVGRFEDAGFVFSPSSSST